MVEEPRPAGDEAEGVVMTVGTARLLETVGITRIDPLAVELLDRAAGIESAGALAPGHLLLAAWELRELLPSLGASEAATSLAALARAIEIDRGLHGLVVTQRRALVDAKSNIDADDTIRILRDAVRVAGDQPLGVRAIIIALVSNPGETIERLLTARDLHKDSLNAAFNEALERMRAPDGKQTKSQPPNAPADDDTASHFAISVASTGSDDPWGRALNDRLGVGDEAKAFARLAAARAFRPPLAVGVFGDWGSGKSFFMRLMYEHLERLASGTPSDAAPEAGAAAFHTDIVQVRFNAWHYVETNLWASLVDHLFSELDHWLRSKERAAEPDELLEHLSTARELTLEAADQLVRRRKEQRDAANRLRKAEQELQSARVSAGSSPAVFWAALKAAMTPHDNDDAYVGHRKKQLTESARKFDEAMRKLGVHDVRTNARALQNATQAMTDEVKRARMLKDGLLYRLQKRSVVALFVIACLTAPVLLVLARNWLAKYIPTLHELHASLLAVSAFLATAATFVSAAARRVRAALDQVEASKRALDAAVAEQIRRPTQEVQARQDDLARLTAATEEARALLTATSDRLAEATRDYASGTGKGRLLRFIRARATDGQYARHLGLIATVRKDFEELASNLVEAAQSPSDDIVKAREAFKKRAQALIDASGDLLVEQEKQKLKDTANAEPPKVTTFQRIVLYIDDLDRCPPDKVVAVLQAVHLLLTFRLFVVVVAVDVRWVNRALERHYPDLLDAADAESNGYAAATAHDYLEKIFQVPYWVRPMDDASSRDFLADRSNDEDDASPATVAPPSAANAPDLSAPDLSAQELMSPPPLVLVANASMSNTGQAQPPAPANDSSPPPSLDTRKLKIEPPEQSFIEALAPFVGGSPRRALRFLNVYRVVKASLGSDDLDALQRGGFRALMTQLAIATGAPRLLGGWLDMLTAAVASASLADVRKSLDGEYWYLMSPDASRLSGALAAYAAASTSTGIEELRIYSAIARRYSFTG
jgi:hypothetical protein